MSWRGYAHRTDPNQTPIVKALRDVRGTTVAITSHASDGFPDLVVGRTISVRRLIEIYGLDGHVPMNFLLEVKRDEKAKLKPDQIKFHKRWHGQVATVCSIDQSLAAIGVYSHAGNYQRAGTHQEAECEDRVRGGGEPARS